MLTMKKITIVLSASVILIAAACKKTQTNDSNNRNTEADNSNNQIAETTALKTIYKDNFLVGNIINPTYMSGNYFTLLATHYNTVTCENDMKPDHLAPSSKGGSYRWEHADNMVNKMADNGIKVHGHVLVWHSQTHSWMTTGTPEQVRENMTDHINTVLSHYKGKIFSWDVVNEAIRDGADSSDWRDCLRTNSGWYRALGADYIELAFRTAREADPDILLYYNDYGLNNQKKAETVRNMVREINDKYKAEGNTRNLIDGIGMQAHYGLWLDINDVRSSLDKFIEIGVIVDITELDVETISTNSSQWGTGKNSDLSASDAQAQAVLYAQLFGLFREYSDHITRVTMWGMDDRNSWKSIGNPCLFDAHLNPKPAFFAAANPGSVSGL